MTFARWSLLGVMTLTACGKGGARAAGGPPGGGMPPTGVEVAVATRDTVVDALDATGQIEAIQAIELRPEIEGRVVEIPATEGTEVAAGAVLVRIDDQELKAQVAGAEAERDLARQALARATELADQKAASAADLERAEAKARSTQAGLDLLMLRLERTTVRAPFAGAVGQRFISLGDYVTTSSRLMTLQSVSPQRVAFSVPEKFASRLRRGQQVTFRVAALTGREFVGRVDFVDPVVALPARTILIKAVVGNSRRELQAGMFAEVRLATEVRSNAVVVPEDALVPLQGANYIWVAADGKAARRQVGIGVRSPGFVEIRSGVESGEQVVVGGQERLFDGAPVNPTIVERTPTRVAE